MRRAVFFVLALTLFAFLPVTAHAADATSLDQLHSAIFASALPPYEDPDPGCTPFYNCTQVWDQCTYHHQKPNGMCVYVCTYTETCRDLACGEPDIVTNGQGRFRIGPFTPGNCPPGNSDIATQGEPD